MIDRQRLDALLDAALDRPESERSAFLDQACETPELREAVARLLALSERETTERQVGGLLWQQLASELAGELKAGDRLGAYRIVSELGRGGMAVVYLGERADGQYEQKVALKILERPASDARAVARFERERRILASLEHAGIARLLDGGIAADGRPWFAMEHVEGSRIDLYCDEQRLDLRRRLSLFVEVARAVAAAHRQLVVHRDIKPSNILVSKDGRPKLLDFGIAKLLEQEGAPGGSPELTRAAVPMTPRYASPEQASGRPVTTASDVYQLGLLLYELLCGERAFEFGGSTPSELRERTATREPTRPSAALERAGAARDGGEARARRRGLASARQLKKLLVGDLDTIVLAALRPQPERRYESAARLADDVERYLGGLPILARPDSPLYRARKFTARNRWAVAASAAGIVAVVGLSVVYGVRLKAERDAARREAEKARQVSQFLADLFKASDPFSAKQVANRTAIELLDDGAKRIEQGGDSSLAGQPEIKAAMLHTIGSVYHGLGRFAEAERLLRAASELRARTLGEGHDDTLASRLLLASTMVSIDRGDEGMELLREIVAAYEARGEPHHAGLGRSLLRLAVLLDREGKPGEALPRVERAVEVLRRAEPAAPVDLSDALYAESVVLNNLGRDADGLAARREAIAVLRDGVSRDHPRLSRLYSALGGDLAALGKIDEASASHAEALRTSEATVGPNHPQTAFIRLNALELELDHERGDPALILAGLEQSRETLDRAFGGRHFSLALARVLKGRALAALGRLPEALAEIDAGCAATLADDGEANGTVVAAYYHRAEILAKLGRGEEARAELLRLLEISRREALLQQRTAPYLLLSMAELERARGDLAAARAAVVEARELFERHDETESTYFLRALAQLAEIEAARGETAAASEAAARARDLLERVQGVSPALRARVLALGGTAAK